MKMCMILVKLFAVVLFFGWDRANFLFLVVHFLVAGIVMCIRFIVRITPITHLLFVAKLRIFSVSHTLPASRCTRSWERAQPGQLA